jgi:hypothetical protein
MLPMQGGTNSKSFTNMCAVLNKEEKDKRKNLKACWYVAKDRDMPIDGSKRERNCHRGLPFIPYSHSHNL